MRTRFYELCWFFLLGYFTYSLMEILFRGYTHWTMAVLRQQRSICCTAPHRRTRFCSNVFAAHC